MPAWMQNPVVSGSAIIALVVFALVMFAGGQSSAASTGKSWLAKAKGLLPKFRTATTSGDTEVIDDADWEAMRRLRKRAKRRKSEPLAEAVKAVDAVFDDGSEPTAEASA